MVDTLAAIPRKALTASLHKCHKLLGLMRRISLTVDGSRGVFTRVQHALKISAGRHIQCTTDMKNELEAWSKLVRSLASRPTHLRELETPPPHMDWNY